MHRPLRTIPASFRQFCRQKSCEAAVPIISVGTNIPVRSGTFVPGKTKLSKFYAHIAQLQYDKLLSCGIDSKHSYNILLSC